MHFWILAATFFLAGALPLAGAPILTADGVEIVNDGSSVSIRETADELRALDRQITTLFKVNGKQKGYPCRIVLSGLLPPGEFLASCQPSGWVFSFNADDGDWRNDFKLRRKLTGLLLLAKTKTMPTPLEQEYLPGWISAGIDRRIRDSKRSELLLRRNRDLPVLRALAELGTFPDFARMRTLRGDLLAGAARVWFGELGRAMTDLAATVSTESDNALLEYALLCSRPGSIEAEAFHGTLGKRFLAAAEKTPLPKRVGGEEWEKLSADQKIQLYLANQIRRIAWNEFSPMPAEVAIAELDEVMTMQYMELDKEGRPTGKNLSAPLTGLPELLCERPDADEIRNRQAYRLQQLGTGNDVAYYRKIEQLQQTLRLLPQNARRASPELAAKFRRELGALRTELEFRRKVELYLEEQEPRFRVPAQFYAEAIQEAARPAPWLLPEEEAYLDRMAAEWR